MNNFYLLYGIDKSIIDYEQKKIIKKLNIDDIIQYQMNEDDILDVIEDASTISMFANKKIIVLNSCDFFKANKTIDNLDRLEEYLTKFNTDTYMIFICNTDKVDARKKIYKLVKKIGKIIECKKESNNYLSNYVNNYVKENDYTIQSADYFLKVVGSNLNNINNELDKLFMYKINDKKISNEDIDKITIRNMENEIFDLTDAVIKNDIDTSLKLLDKFTMKNYDEVQILILLANQFRFLYQVKRLLNKNKRYDEIAKILEVNPYRVKFTIKKLYTYTEDMLLDNIRRLAKIDHDIKLGIMNKRLALELFMIKR
jgi:DNA polymerase-3 subunit delta